MEKQRVRADLSTVYDNQTTNLAGIIIGEKGCFSDTQDFKEYSVHKLIGVATTYDNPYLADTDKYFKGYKYYIPLDKVNFEESNTEPSYRAFKSIDEFEYVTQNTFSIGESVIIRDRVTHNESELLYGGYFVNDENKVFICLGSFIFSFDELLNYEFYINNGITEWETFGVIENE